jgi:hypothetical protein
MRIGSISSLIVISIFATFALSSAACQVEDAIVGISADQEPANQIPTDKSLLRFKIRDGRKTVADVSKIILHIVEINFINASGQSFTVSKAPAEVDLLSLLQHVTLEIGYALLPKGSYTQIRMVLGPNNRVIKTNGTSEPIKVPSGLQSGLKFDGAFELRGGRITHVMANFDSTKSVTWNNGEGYMLKPVIPISSVASLTTEQEAALQSIAGVAGGDLMLEKADLVFQGRADAQGFSEGLLYGETPMIFTNVTLGVLDPIKGDLPGSVQLELLGGRLGEKVLYVPHVTRYVTGERFLSFLKSYPEGLGAISEHGGKVGMN